MNPLSLVPVADDIYSAEGQSECDSGYAAQESAELGLSLFYSGDGSSGDYLPSGDENQLEIKMLTSRTPREEPDDLPSPPYIVGAQPFGTSCMRTSFIKSKPAESAAPSVRRTQSFLTLGSFAQKLQRHIAAENKLIDKGVIRVPAQYTCHHNRRNTLPDPSYASSPEDVTTPPASSHSAFERVLPTAAGADEATDIGQENLSSAASRHHAIQERVPSRRSLRAKPPPSLLPIPTRLTDVNVKSRCDSTELGQFDLRQLQPPNVPVAFELPVVSSNDLDAVRKLSTPSRPFPHKPDPESEVIRRRPSPIGSDDPDHVIASSSHSSQRHNPGDSERKVLDIDFDISSDDEGSTQGRSAAPDDDFETLEPSGGSSSNLFREVGMGASDPGQSRSLQYASKETIQLTFAEFQHIRQVHTKRGLESLINDPVLYADVGAGKICFRCRQVRLKNRFAFMVSRPLLKFARARNLAASSAVGTNASSVPTEGLPIARKTDCVFCSRSVCEACTRTFGNGELTWLGSHLLEFQIPIELLSQPNQASTLPASLSVASRFAYEHRFAFQAYLRSCHLTEQGHEARPVHVCFDCHALVLPLLSYLCSLIEDECGGALYGHMRERSANLGTVR